MIPQQTYMLEILTQRSVFLVYNLIYLLRKNNYTPPLQTKSGRGGGYLRNGCNYAHDAMYHPFFRGTVNWFLFVMYQFSPFSSVPSMTNLRTDEYEYHWLYENVSLIIVFERKYMYYHACAKNLNCIFDLSTEKVTRIEKLFILKGMNIC